MGNARGVPFGYDKNGRPGNPPLKEDVQFPWTFLSPHCVDPSLGSVVIVRRRLFHGLVLEECSEIVIRYAFEPEGVARGRIKVAVVPWPLTDTILRFPPTAFMRS